MTARDEILAALPRLRCRLGRDDCTPAEVIDELRRSGSVYSDSTIRIHVVSRMCANAPDNHAVSYKDLERVGLGRYRLRTQSESAASPQGVRKTFADVHRS